MIAFTDWFPLALPGSMLTLIGVLKLWGLRRGIVGGADKPLVQRLCGTCPTWESRSLRLGFPLLFLAIGLGELGWLGWLVYSRLSGR